jgi:hypothetical protein
MSKILSQFTNSPDIGLNTEITSVQANGIKNNLGTWVLTNAPTLPVRVVTGDVVLDFTNQDTYLSGTASYDVTLPVIPAGDVNVCFNFLRTANNKNGATPVVIRILPNAGNTINGASSYTIWTKDSTLTLNCNTSILGTDWKVTNKFNNVSDLRFSVYRATSQTIPNSAVASIVQMATENYDTNSDYDTSTFTYTARATGRYQFFGAILFTSGTSSTFTLQIVANAQSYRRGQDVTANVWGCAGALEVYLTSGQTVNLRASSDGAARDLIGGNGLVSLEGGCISIDN